MSEPIEPTEPMLFASEVHRAAELNRISGAMETSLAWLRRFEKAARTAEDPMMKRCWEGGFSIADRELTRMRGYFAQVQAGRAVGQEDLDELHEGLDRLLAES